MTKEFNIDTGYDFGYHADDSTWKENVFLRAIYYDENDGINSVEPEPMVFSPNATSNEPTDQNPSQDSNLQMQA